MTRLPLIAALLLCSCADRLYYPNGNIAAVLMSDRTGESFHGGGISYSSATATHSTVAHAHWRGATKLASILGSDAMAFASGAPVALRAAALVPPAVSTYQQQPVATPAAKMAHP